MLDKNPNDAACGMADRPGKELVSMHSSPADGTLVRAAVRLFRRMGLLWLSFWRLALRPLRRLCFRNGFSRRLDFFTLRLRKWMSRRRQRVLYRFYHLVKFCADVWRVVHSGWSREPEASLPRRLWNALRAFGCGVRNNGERLLRLLNCVLPAAAVAAFLLLIQYVSGLNYVLEVESNGQSLGYIQDEGVYTEAHARLHSRMIYQEEDPVLYTVPTFSIAVVDRGSLQTGTELTDALIRTSAADIVQATGVTVGGEFLGAVRDSALLQKTLEDLLNAHRQGNDQVAFTKEVELERGLFLQEHLRDAEALARQLSSNVQQSVYYTAVSGDTPSGIAAAFGMTLSQLEELNPSIMTQLKIGQQVLVSKAEAYLPVKETRTVTYTEAIPYETVYVDNANLYEGTTQTLSEGREGTVTVTAQVSYVEGEEVERTELSRAVETPAVSARVARGTMKLQTVSGYENAGKSDYGLIWPVYGGYISQYYGHTPYEYWHNGIDYAGTGYGAPIVSVLPGTVTYAGWRGSYGNLVIVSHGNGMETWYAHCANILVRTGDTVAQGQQLARVGSTGNSSGNHLHFRVIVNGSEKNPLTYLP